MAAEPRGDCSVMLELVEEALDQIALPVGPWTELRLDDPVLERADVGTHPLLFEFLADGIAVVAAVGEQHCTLSDIIEHVLGRLAIVGLTGREFQLDRQAVAVYERGILVVFPPRERPMQSLSPPFVAVGGVLMDPDGGRVKNHLDATIISI